MASKRSRSDRAQQEHGSIREAWQLLRPHVGPRVGALVGVVLLGLLASLAATSVVLLVEPLWNDVLFPVESDEEQGFLRSLGLSSIVGSWGAALGRFFGDAGEDPRTGVLWGLSLFGGVVGLIAAAAEYSFVCLSRWISLRMVVDVRMRLAEHLMGLSVRYHIF